MIRYASIFYCIFVLSAVVESERFVENTGPHEGEQIECRGKRMVMSDHLKEVRCMPRTTLTKLRPEPGYVYVPDVVPINRCSGFCGPSTCVPLSWKSTNVVVRRYPLSSNKSTCHLVRVVEHTKCKCGCNVMPEDCNSKQVYVEEKCTCKCMNVHDNLRCSSQRGMIWDPKSCKCVCDTPEQECSTGYEWIPSMCSCGKVMLTEDEKWGK